MRKYFFTMCTIALFAIGFVSSSSEPSEVEKDFQGTYILTDKDGVKWTFTFTCGETNQVTAIRNGMSEDDMYYGTWSGVDHILLDFANFHAGDPKLRFPDGKLNYYGEHFYISFDGWLYKGFDNWRSKNQTKRIRIIKQ